MRNLLIRLSETKPLIIAVEDLHWIDKTSEEFLDYFINSLAHNPILLILLYRPEYTHQWGSKSYYSKIGLDQLTIESSADLVSAILEGGEVAAELKELILSRSAGNPLFMEEFTHTLLENGSIDRENNQFVLRRKIGDIQVPDTIQGIIAARMDRLEENLKRTMQVASVIGRDFAFRILQTITGMKEELKSCLLNLQGLEFIYEKSLFPDLEYIFKPALTQEVAYNSLLNKRRREIHEKIGEAIEIIYAERLPEFYEMLAYHYQKSNNIEKSYLYVKMSSKKAIDRYSHREAIHYLKEAKEILNKLPRSDDTKRKQVEIGRLLMVPADYLGKFDDVVSHLKEGLATAEELNDQESILAFSRALNWHYLITSDIENSMKYGERILELLGESNDLEMMAIATFSICINYATACHWLGIIDIAPTAIKLLEKEGKEHEYFGLGWPPYGMICAVYGMSLGFIGKFEESKDFFEKGIRTSVKMNDLMTLSNNEWMLGMIFTVKGDGSLAVEYLKNSIAHGEQVNYPFVTGYGTSYLALAYCLIGDLKLAIETSKKSICLAKESGIERLWLTVYRVSSKIHCAMRDFKRAIIDAKESLRAARKAKNKFYEGLSLIDYGNVLWRLEVSETAEAEKTILQGIDISNEFNARPFAAQGYLTLGELYAGTGHLERALETLKKAESMFKEMEMDYYVDKTRRVLNEI